ncbi:MAG: hypothetical protein FWF49_06165 [Oscillospiraceae bacterium]|nr:hypothetical protein [Oscillospiraceae bacterium]
MIAFIVYAIQWTGIMLAAFYIYAKAIRYTATKSRNLIAVGWCLLWAVFYAAAPLVTQLPLTVPLACLASVIFTFFLTREKIETVVSAYLLSYGISFVLNYVAGFVIGGISMLLLSKTGTLDYNQPIYILLYFITAALQLLFAFLLFRIRRFRKGFPFIFKRFAVVAALVFAGAIMVSVTWIGMLDKSEGAYAGYFFVAGILVAGTGIYILVRRLMMTYQRRRAQQNAADYYEKRWREEQEKIKDLETLVKDQSAILHNFADRIEAMGNRALALGDAALGEDVQKLKKDFQDKMASRKGKQLLPPTNNKAIDTLFEHFAKQFADEQIDFSLMINGSIVYMVEHVIDQGELETLIVNHLKDAQIAVNAGDNPFRRIAVTLGLTEKEYAFTVYDSGIPFTVDTLLRLGTGRVTTHADTGGSGIGFETTFEIIRGCNASLIITEQKPSKMDYTKSVSIRFDGKNQYIIETYRPDEFPADEKYRIVGH